MPLYPVDYAISLDRPRFQMPRCSERCTQSIEQQSKELQMAREREKGRLCSVNLDFAEKSCFMRRNACGARSQLLPLMGRVGREPRRGRCSRYVGDEWADSSNYQSVADCDGFIDAADTRNSGIRSRCRETTLLSPYARAREIQTTDCRRPYHTWYPNNVTRTHDWLLGPLGSPGPASIEMVSLILLAIGVCVQRRHMERAPECTVNSIIVS